MRSLDELLSHSAAAYPENTAVVDPGRGEISYSALDALASELAELLRRHGVVARRSGGRVRAEVPGNGGRDLRNSESRSRLHSRGPDRSRAAKPRHPLRLLRPGCRYRRIPRGEAPRRVRARGEDPGRAALASPLGREHGPSRSPARKRAGARAGRARLHPLHLRLHGEAEGRNAHPRERPGVRRLVLRGVPPHGRGSILLSRSVSFRPVDPGPVRPDSTRRRRGPHRR